MWIHSYTFACPSPKMRKRSYTFARPSRKYDNAHTLSHSEQKMLKRSYTFARPSRKCGNTHTLSHVRAQKCDNTHILSHVRAEKCDNTHTLQHVRTENMTTLMARPSTKYDKLIHFGTFEPKLWYQPSSCPSTHPVPLSNIQKRIELHFKTTPHPSDNTLR